MNGILDLRGLDLSSLGAIPLSGNWIFYHKEFVDPTSPSPIQGKDAGPIHVPGPWNGQVIGNQKLPGNTYGTYEMTVLMDSDTPHPGIHMPQMGTSYRLYINGKLISSAGSPGEGKDKTIPGIIRKVLPVKVEDGQLHILIHVANYYHRNGGFRDAIRLGDFETIRNLRENRLFTEFVLIGAFWIMGIYHLGLYWLRRQNTSPLWFFIFSISFSFRSLFLGEAYIYNLIPGIPYPTGLFFEYFFGFVSVLGFVFFLVNLYPSEFPKNFSKYIFIYTIFNVFVLLFFDSVVASYNILQFEVFIILLGIVGGYNLIRAVKNHRTGATMILVGWAILFITIIYDITLYNFIHDGFQLGIIGVLIFIFTQTHVLSKRSAMAFQQVETLTEELEERVIKRTIELIHAKNEAEEALNSRTVFLANMSHEIRTPMNSVLGLIELLEDSPLSEEQRNRLRKIRTSARTLFNMIVDILDLSNLEKGKIELLHEEFSPRDCIRDLYGLYNFQKVENEIEFILTIDPRTPDRLMGDVYRLSQVLSNLLSNSFKFTERGRIEFGTTFVETGGGKTSLEFFVKDTGPGIPQEKQERIFDYFTRIDRDIQPGKRGAGIGLAISKRIVDLMGGKIRFETVEGQGTSFFIRCSWDQFQEHTQTEVENRVTEVDRTTAPRILLADDTDDNIFLLERFLSSLTDRITVTHNGEEAVQAFAESLKGAPETRFHAVILDIQMPVMDGYEAARLIREIEQKEELSPIPLIALTAHVSDRDVQEAHQAGFSQHMKKPFHKQEILDKLRSILEKGDGDGPKDPGSQD